MTCIHAVETRSWSIWRNCNRGTNIIKYSHTSLASPFQFRSDNPLQLNVNAMTKKHACVETRLIPACFYANPSHPIVPNQVRCLTFTTSTSKSSGSLVCRSSLLSAAPDVGLGLTPSFTHPNFGGTNILRLPPIHIPKTPCSTPWGTCPAPSSKAKASPTSSFPSFP